jgi:hypothetical protein
VPCPACGNANEFEQDYAFHAGFSDCGFLYNEAGNLTFTWSSFDPAYVAIVGQHHPWTLEADQQGALERALVPSPAGDRWLFANPARCLRCAAAIAGPISTQIYFYVYSGSVWTYRDPRSLRLIDYLRKPSP